MSDYLIRYSKLEGSKFFSHLDTARMFDRAVKRAGFKVAYSEGFNPHPVIRFARALSVGVSGEAEILLLRLRDNPGEDEVLNELSVKLPEGFEISGCVKVEGKASKLAVEKAAYSVFFEVREGGFDRFVVESALQSFLNQTYQKRTKSGEKEVKISDFVEDARILPSPASLVPRPSPLSLELTIRFLNGETLKPDLICQELISRYDLPLEISSIHCTSLVPR